MQISTIPIQIAISFEKFDNSLRCVEFDKC